MNDQHEDNVWMKRKQERDASCLSFNLENFPSVIGGTYNITFPSIIVCGVNVPSIIVFEDIRIPSFIMTSEIGA